MGITFFKDEPASDTQGCFLLKGVRSAKFRKIEKKNL